jgi:adapter protein MecA 1/2
MKIERIDDKTVRCFLSNEELEQYDIDYKDFVMRSEKAKEVVQEIIEQAEEEVGYKPPKFAFDLQIMMLPEQGLVLTFSEREPDGEKLMACLKEMKKVLQQVKENVGAKDQAEPAKKQEEQQEVAAKEPELAIFAFATVRDVMDYASVLPAGLRIDSELYEMDDVFYLFLKKGHASYNRYSRACVQAMEFADMCTADEKQALWIQEHGTCLIAEKVVKKLRR